MRRLAALSAAVAVLVAAACVANPAVPPPVTVDPTTVGFTPFEPSATVPDHLGDRLCDETATFADPSAEKVDIACRFEGGRFAPTDAEPTDEIVVMTWNMERNYRLDAQIEAFRSPAPGLVRPDVIIASEIDRGCARSGNRNGAREFAKALGLDYVFGVEFVEGVRSDLPTPCEHGQAIFSRFPIGNVELFRHRNLGFDRFDSAREPRIGSRADLEADILVGDRLVHVVSVHYDDRPEEEPGRIEQARATARNNWARAVPTVVGGDMNTILYFLDPSPWSVFDPAARELWTAGWVDTHVGQAGRVTVPFLFLGVVFPAVVDLLWVRGFEQDRVSARRGCPVARCGELSDHLPQWITLALD